MSSREITSKVSNKKIRTVSYKGSKRKLLADIKSLANEINATTIFDGFSGTGIVSAYLRREGMKVYANDLNFSSYLYGRVFLEGYDRSSVSEHLGIMNSLIPKSGWVTKNYSGTRMREVRTLDGLHERPLAYLRPNAMMIDAARSYVRDLPATERTKNALLFSIILAADSVFNNSNDQKSSLKKWTSKSKKDIVFSAPTLIEGSQGKQLQGDVFSVEIPKEVEMVYYDPPYTSGVLYGSCYHLNDTYAINDEPTLDSSYALPRPERASFRDKPVSSFYSKKTIREDFRNLLSNASNAKRIVLSYSDAPRNTIDIKSLVSVCEEFGRVSVRERDHKICSQANSQQKISTKLKEYFIVIDA